MPIITISPDEALRKEFIEQTIITKLNPQLYFVDKFPVIDLDGASTFQYFTDVTSAEDDIIAGKMSTPMTMSELGNLSKINVSPISKQVGDTYEFGYKLEFSKNVTRENGFVDEILRAYERASYGMARKINSDIIANIQNTASAPGMTLADLADGAWQTSTDISSDIITMQANMDQDAWDFELTDLFTNKAQFYQAKQYYRKTGYPWNPSDVEGSAMNNAKSNILAGNVIGMDMNAKPITIYKNTDAEFSSDPQNSLVQVNKYRQLEYPYKHVIDLWCEIGIGTKYGNAMSVNTGF